MELYVDIVSKSCQERDTNIIDLTGWESYYSGAERVSYFEAKSIMKL